MHGLMLSNALLSAPFRNSYFSSLRLCDAGRKMILTHDAVIEKSKPSAMSEIQSRQDYGKDFVGELPYARWHTIYDLYEKARDESSVQTPFLTCVRIADYILDNELEFNEIQEIFICPEMDTVICICQQVEEEE